MLAYQNAPGDGHDKAFTAAITFGILGFLIIVLVRMIQFLVPIAGLVLVLGVADHLVNDGSLRATILASAAPAAGQVTSWLDFLIFGPR